jgi:hypothetical protein
MRLTMCEGLWRIARDSERVKRYPGLNAASWRHDLDIEKVSERTVVSLVSISRKYEGGESKGVAVEVSIVEGLPLKKGLVVKGLLTFDTFSTPFLTLVF